MASRAFEQAWNDRLLSVPTVGNCRQLSDSDFEVMKADLDCSSASGCWIWKGRMYDSFRYPPFYVGEGKIVPLHRLLYHNFEKPLQDQAGVPGKDQLFVLHCCKEVAGVDNNRLCCNPKHLKLGTKKENTAHLLAGHDGDAEHISAINNRNRLIKEPEAEEIAHAIEADELAEQLQTVDHYVEKYKISSRGNFYGRIYDPLLKAKGIEFNYNAPGRSVQQIPDNFFDNGVSQIKADFTSDQLRPQRY